MNFFSLAFYMIRLFQYNNEDFIVGVGKRFE